MKRLIDRAGWALAGALALALVLVAARVIQAGPLDPPGAPASTMHTLDDSPVVWDRALAANDGANSCNSSRFKCVLGGAAVLDRETGLVWQQAPGSDTETWYAAGYDCGTVQLGGRYGWRLPRIEELRSLLDGTGLLPAGVFSNVQAVAYYWSASTESDPALPNAAFVARLDIAPITYRAAKAGTEHVWCVRGGAGIDGM